MIQISDPATNSSKRQNAFPLPSEIIAVICRYLPNRDIKNLRLASSCLAHAAILRFDRVFISANPRNIEVFRAVASHDVFRGQVAEIVYDDALLPEAASHIDVNQTIFCLDPTSDAERCVGPGPPHFFRDVCFENIAALASANNIKDPKYAEQFIPQLPPVKSWDFYFTLLKEQREVLASGEYGKALNYGLQQFPRLHRITITGAAHGRLFNPVYETPMIRQFPRHLNYPIPPGWLSAEPLWGDLRPWTDSGYGWLGVRTVLSALAQNKDSQKVSELVINSHLQETGLNVRMFEQECSAFLNFETLLARPNFRHLKLDLLVSGQEKMGWLALRNGLLRRAIGGAGGSHGLEYLSLRVESTEAYPSLMDESQHVPLSVILPVNRLKNLKHLGLQGFFVKENDLLSLLLQLPETIATVDLSFLIFMEGSYHSLLPRIRDTLDWTDRTSKPKLSIRVSVGNKEGQHVQIHKALNAFLYKNGPNPFHERKSLNDRNTQVKAGIGLVKDPLGSYMPLVPGARIKAGGGIFYSKKKNQT